jgi:hypothetical protein
MGGRAAGGRVATRLDLTGVPGPTLWRKPFRRLPAREGVAGEPEPPKGEREK